MLYCSTTRIKGNWTKQNILKYQTLYNHDTKGMSLMYKKHWIFPMIKMLSFTFMYRRVHSSKLDHLLQITFLRPLFYKCSIGIWTLNNHPSEICLQYILNILYSTCRLTCCGENPCSTTTSTTSVFCLDIQFFVQQCTTYFSRTFCK